MVILRRVAILHLGETDGEWIQSLWDAAEMVVMFVRWTPACFNRFERFFPHASLRKTCKPWQHWGSAVWDPPSTTPQWCAGRPEVVSIEYRHCWFWWRTSCCPGLWESVGIGIIVITGLFVDHILLFHVLAEIALDFNFAGGSKLSPPRFPEVANILGTEAAR